MTSPTGWSGGVVTPWATCVLAPNPGPMTLDGTNTWLLHDSGQALVVDPGPDDADHRSSVRDALEETGAAVSAVLLTHGHADHSEGAAALAAELRVGVRALDPAHRRGELGLGDADAVRFGERELTVLATPGHTADSLTFLVGDAALTGDTVLGRGTSVVAYPDGRLQPYLDSLSRLLDCAVRVPLRRILPGHGPVLDDPAGVLEGYLRHRETRLQQVREALAAGARTPSDVVARVYSDVDRSLWPAAERSVAAQMDYLSR